MRIRVQIPAPLRRFTGDKEIVEVDVGADADVRAVLDAVCALWPDLRPRLFDGDGVWPYLQLFHAQTPATLATPVSGKVEVLAAAVGG